MYLLPIVCLCFGVTNSNKLSKNIKNGHGKLKHGKCKHWKRKPSKNEKMRKWRIASGAAGNVMCFFIHAPTSNFNSRPSGWFTLSWYVSNSVCKTSETSERTNITNVYFVPNRTLMTYDLSGLSLKTTIRCLPPMFCLTKVVQYQIWKIYVVYFWICV